MVTIRKLTLPLLAAVLAAAALAPLAFRTEQRFTPTPIDPFAEARAEGEAPEDFFLFSRIFSDGAPTPEQLRAAGAQARRIARETAASAPEVASQRWRYVGPSNIGGRVVDIVVDPDLKDTIYVATASGGVWKSTDAGKTYDPIWPGNWPQAMGAMTMGSDDTLWLGTGETNPGGGSLTYSGNGVYKSTDRGRTWKRVGLTKSQTIGRIAVDPKDPKHVLVAASGDLFNPGGQRGLYETRDGGATWKLILEPATPTTGATDIQIDPKNPKNIYVSTWDHIRYPDWRDYAGPGSGIYRSRDGGKTFERLGPANGLPPPSENVGRIGLGLDPQNPKRVYAIYVNDLGTFQAWYISDNGGDTWIQPPPHPNLVASQLVYGWWFGRVWVDPRDSNHVFVAGVPLVESFDGGRTFPVSQGQQHVDHHALVWDPNVKGRVYNGNDGGVYRSEKNAENGSWIHGKDQPWVQFYTIDVSEQDPTRINGGLQDQGNVRSWGGDDWNSYGPFGDGVKNAIDPKDKEHVFACTQYGNCSVSFDGGKSFMSFDERAFSDRRGWLTPIEFDPNNPDVVYWAGDYVNRSRDGGRTWTVISHDLGLGEVGRERNPLYAGHYGTVQTIGVTKAAEGTLYAGTDNGHLWKTTNGGGVWLPLQAEGVPDRWVTHITVSQKNADLLYATFSGYRQGDRTPYVLRSTDGGQSFKDITGNLPKAPVNDVVLVGNDVYVATDVGVFTSGAAGGKWLKLGSGLPLAPVTDIRYIAKNNSLYAGTFGRAIWRVTLP